MDYRRFFTTQPISNNLVTLVGEEFLHCVKVTRHKMGYYIIVNNNDGFDYICRIKSIEKDLLIAEIVEKKQNYSELKQNITLYQAVCKEFDFIVQKAVELGVNKIVPFYSEFSQKNILNKERIDKIVLESTKQCGRGVLPITENTKDFLEVLDTAKKHSNRIFCYEKAPYSNLLSAVSLNAGDIGLIIGSEGGFSEKEVALADGFKIVSLGKRVLRAETASIAAIVMLESLTGEL